MFNNKQELGEGVEKVEGKTDFLLELFFFLSSYNENFLHNL